MRIRRKVDKRSLKEKLAVIDRYQIMCLAGGNELTMGKLEMDKGRLEEIRSRRRQLRKEYMEVTREAVPGRMLVPINGGFDRPFHGEKIPFDASIFKGPVLIVPDTDDECQPVEKDFNLELTVIDLTNNWNATTVQETNGGVMGWSTSLDRTPILTNMNGKGTIIGQLELNWSGTIPEDGVYIFQPNIHMLIDCYCFADGYFFGERGTDAEASVSLISMVSNGNEILHFDNPVICEAVSERYTDEDTFAEYLMMLSNVIGFEGVKGEKVTVRIRLYGNTWTRESADAEIGVNFFGVLSNSPQDTVIPVNG